MKICLMTSNRPRHIKLAESLSKVASELVIIQEAKPAKLFSPGSLSKNNADYIKRMEDAETEIFGELRFTSFKSASMVLGLDEISTLDMDGMSILTDCDMFIVFGCGIIKGPIADFLFTRKAINLHMGLSPYFRGSACNFWAQYLGYPEFVGATIHYLSALVDKGPIIKRVVPIKLTDDGFMNGMLAVLSGQKALLHIIKHGTANNQPIALYQDEKTINLSKRADFDEKVVFEFMEEKRWVASGLNEKRRETLLKRARDIIRI